MKTLTLKQANKIKMVWQELVLTQKIQKGKQDPLEYIGICKTHLKYLEK